ncbi:hypothetical protein GGR53DRAFT_466546 [Hypoxylon sp. FL1150]|nr:hypothetical protein GGR53DRAFT_466546 [Hypoxylon sp. FL1150]
MRFQAIIAVAAGLLTGGATAQDMSAASSCIAALSSLDAAIPTPANPAFASFVTSYASANAATLATDPCAAATAIPASFASAAASYESQLASFGRAHASDVSSAAALCGTAVPGLDPASFSSQLGLLTGYAGTTCHIPSATASAVVTDKAGETTATATATPASAATASGTTSTPNAAPAKPTGMAAGVAAAAGLLGAVAMLAL